MTGTFRPTLRRILAAEDGEKLSTLLLSTYLLLVIAAYVILKAVRDSLYLDEFGAVKLPYVIVGIAVLVGLFVDAYIRISRRVRVPLLTGVTLVFLISNVLLFWGLGRAGRTWLYPVLYVWVGCYGVIAPVQVWTMVNEIFATRQVKRLLGFLGAGGIAGAVGGGALAGALARQLGTIHLLLVVAVILTVCVVLVAILAPHRRQARPASPESRPANLRQAARTIAGSTHLKVIGGLVWISALCTTLVDYQFKAAASGAGFSRDQLTAFFGTAYGAMALGCLGTQVLFVRPLLRRVGLGAAILVLPVSLIGGSTVFIALGGLWTATLLKAGDGFFKHSIDRSSKELAYLPVPGTIKVSVKSAIDMVLDRLGDGTGGILLMVLATWLGMGSRPIAAVNLVLLAGWLVLALALRRSYVSGLQESIADSSGLADSEESLDDADARATLLRALRSEDDHEVLAALDLVGLTPGSELHAELRRLAHEGSPEVRARVFGAMLESEGEGLPDELTRRLESEDQDLLVKALDLVLAADQQEVQQRARELIGSAAPETRGAMLALLVRRLGPEFEPMAERMLESLVERGSPPPVRRALATALGLLPRDSSLVAPLGRLLEDEDAQVRSLAAESAGRLRRENVAPRLVELLGDPRTRRSARSALARISPAAAAALRRALLAEETPPEIRRHTPRLLARLATGSSLGGLASALSSDNEEIRNAALAALAWKRRLSPNEMLPEAARVVARTRLSDEIASCRALLEAWDAIPAGAGEPELRCLRAALRERLLGGVERIFSWLELTRPPELIRTVRVGLRNGDRVRRENSIELLERVLSGDLKRAVTGLLDRVPWDERARPRVRASVGVDDAIRRLAAGSDRWMAAWAVNLAGRRNTSLSGARRREGRRGTNDLLHEELARLDATGERGSEESRMAITLIDKVMTLKSIDLFRGVPVEDLVHVARVVREQRFGAGAALFSEGDPPGPLFIPIDGRVMLRRGGTPTGEIPAGSPVGTWSLFDDQPRSHSAVALDELRALVVEREDFYDALAENVEILRSLIGDLLRRLQRLTF